MMVVATGEYVQFDAALMLMLLIYTPWAIKKEPTYFFL